MGIPQRGDYGHHRESKREQSARQSCESPQQHPDRSQEKDLGLDRREVQSSPSRLDHAIEQAAEHTGVPGVT
jgi:hypothetical protein